MPYYVGFFTRDNRVGDLCIAAFVLVDGRQLHYRCPDGGCFKHAGLHHTGHKLWRVVVLILDVNRHPGEVPVGGEALVPDHYGHFVLSHHFSVQCPLHTDHTYKNRPSSVLFS